MDSLRSQIAKNAMLGLTDCFEYLKDGQIADQEITLSYSKLFKKVGETNQFLANEAKLALTRLSEHTPPQKSI